MAITDDEPSFHERRDARPARGANWTPPTDAVRCFLRDLSNPERMEWCAPKENG